MATHDKQFGLWQSAALERARVPRTWTLILTPVRRAERKKFVMSCHPHELFKGPEIHGSLPVLVGKWIKGSPNTVITAADDCEI
jgi:hypothetical protein